MLVQYQEILITFFLTGVPRVCQKNKHYRKCINITWFYHIDSAASSHYKNIIFFTIFYRRLKPNEQFNLRRGNDYVDTEHWSSEDVPKERWVDTL